uniref:NADH:ubiquinone reductase (H(+)-translocating) n=2 Tax=unclassified Rhinebothroides TaxID=2627538 RepID=A0A8K1SXG0_9CEST|nr:NADH dehydrogenase subunit 5 [Rhinebothroides sp. MZUSP 8027]UFQ88940.1 NADH dehydrogenase subunit 5 [Rhinebothroides sp. MZUSP 8028]
MLFVVFMLFILVCSAYICINNSFILYLNNMTLLGNYWEIVSIFDLVSVSILLMLSICFGYAYFYTGHYFSGDIMGIELNKIICIFVGVMATLVLTGDFFSTLVLWEYLGVVSYFLILFYSNYLSLRSSVVTLVASRFGDVCLFIIIGVWLYSIFPSYLPALLIFFIVITKSAGFPFISWLLEAMRAPTPVSSLVHSSTLVAAGVWFSMRYDIFVFLSDSLIILSVLLLTIFITGLCCFFFLDLKKIVALSTCNNISWCILYLLCGDVTLSLFQLTSHGVSKCLLFMLVGDVMSGAGGSQASNCVYVPRLYNNWGVFGLFSLVLGLSGAPFIGVFFTKHFFLTSFFLGLNYILVGFVFLCVFLSYFYSFRLCHVLISLNNSCSAGVLFSFGSGLMVYFWLAINYFVAGTLDEAITLSQNAANLLILFQLISCFIAYYFYNSNFMSNWSSSLFGCDNVVEMMYAAFWESSQIVSLFFFRWDYLLLSIFHSTGFSAIRVFNFSLLNIIILLLLISLMCCSIIY